MDKLKNALFEEEYVEVEERPRQKAKKVEKKEKSKQRPEKPIAKKIAVPEKVNKIPPKSVVEEAEEEMEDGVLAERASLKSESEYRFPAMAEEDFSVTQPFNIIEDVEPAPQVERVQPKISSFDEKPLYHSSHKTDNFNNYDEYRKKDLSGAYEKKVEHTGFKPSPIISPIYGVLDKNYTREEVVDKKEVRISSYSREDLDLDAIRRKAYGKLEDDLQVVQTEDIADEVEPVEENLLVDLSQEDTPTVNKVTVGDAEEYFEDLGLEYNNDYIDASKEKASGRRVKEEKQYEEVEEEKTEKAQVAPVVEDDDNLFDLIDSMYSEE